MLFVLFLFSVATCESQKSHKTVESLERRAESLRCSVVLIKHDNTFGTGFFVTSNGDVVTASHVLGDRSWSSPDGKNLNVSLSLPANYTITDGEGHDLHPSAKDVEQNPESWGADIALIHTGHSTKCWLKRGNDSTVQAGEHVLTMGYPGLAFQSVSLYEGIVSVAHLVGELPLGKTIQGQAVMPQNESFRVQMPISPGLSGSPLVNNQNGVIGVIVSAGAWNPDFDALNQAVVARNQQRTATPGQTYSRDVLDLLSELLDVLHNYDSPGYGDATPLRYLTKAPAANQTRETLSH